MEWCSSLATQGGGVPSNNKQQQEVHMASGPAATGGLRCPHHCSLLELSVTLASRMHAGS